MAPIDRRIKTRLGLDIGTNSIGWWLYALEGGKIVRVLDGGARIFSNGRDPVSGTSLAVDRRGARAMRRRRDRYLRRRTSLMRKLAEAGLMPGDPAAAKALQSLDPFALRAKGLDQPLSLHELGRALFHLNQRRGFKSNRKTDRGDNESGKIKDATARLDQAMMAKGARTYGEFLHMRRAAAPNPRHVPGVRTRLTLAARDGEEKAEAGYDFYPDRHHLEEEFEKLWAAQQPHHPERLTEELHNALFETIFYQRPLKEPEVGLCLFTDERRLPKAHPLTQRRVLYETVNALRLTADGRKKDPLTKDQRDQVIALLDNKKPTKSLSGMRMKLTALAKALKVPSDQRFTLETANRDAIACDPVRASLSHPDRFGPRWSSLDMDQQVEVVRRLRAVESDAEYEALVAWLIESYGLARDKARAAASAPLPEGYARLGETATRRILTALMEKEVDGKTITYDKAVAACGWSHADGRTGEILDRLPYYGQILDKHVIPGSHDRTKHDPATQAVEFYGRITNPTVHIGLNQLRHLVNRIIDVWGRPEEIVVELARELKQSERQKKEFQKTILENTKAAEHRSKQLGELDQADSGANRLRLRLWEALGPDPMTRNCPYTGQKISPSMLFDGSCEIDHILPYSRTLDDSFANRTLCFMEANREKRNQTPWEAWGGTGRWSAIEANLKNLPDAKRWRFAPDALEQFEEKADFLDRALVDTQYLSRIARSYLEALYGDDADVNHVWVVPGRMTEMLRRHWGLNSLLSDRERGAVKAKNRTDHRHHAIDAAVIGATDRGLVHRIQSVAGRDEAEGKGAEDVARSTAEPWKGFRDDIEAQLAKIIVSHRCDHGRIDFQARKRGQDSTAGRLHNDTAYKPIDSETVVSRVSLLSLKPGDIPVTTRGKNIQDPYLQELLAAATEGLEGKAFEQALHDFAAKAGPYQGIRRLRLTERLKASARVELKDPRGVVYKAYKADSNHCYEIWRNPDGKLATRVVTTYQAHRQDGDGGRHPAAKRLLKLFKRDMVAIEREGRTVYCYVQKVDSGHGAFLAPHSEANADARSRDKSDDFKLIQMAAGPLVKAKVRRIHVDEMGRLRDPGPPRGQV